MRAGAGGLTAEGPPEGGPSGDRTGAAAGRGDQPMVIVKVVPFTVTVKVPSHDPEPKST
jgi:hypothetical protein